jgi:hypothetical protein
VLLVAPVAFGAGPLFVAACLLVAGAGASVWVILVATIRQNLSPENMLGRFYSASRVITWGIIPLGAALAGIGAEIWGLRVVYLSATVVALIVFTLFLAFARRTDLDSIIVREQDPASG